MYRSSHPCSQIGGTGVNVSILGVEHELLARLCLDAVPDRLDPASQTVKDPLDISSHLHRDDAELVLLVDPGQEGLVLVVEYPPALWPISLHTGSNQVLVAGYEKEVVIYQLLSHLFIHPCQWKVSPSQVSLQISECFLHELLDLQSLDLSDSGGQAEPIDAPSHPDPGGLDGGGRVDVALDLGDVHVALVYGIWGDAMIVLDDGIEDLSKILVGVPVPGVDAAVLVVKLDSTGDGLAQAEAGGGGLDAGEFGPEGGRHVLRYKRMARLDLRERFRHRGKEG